MRTVEQKRNRINYKTKETVEEIITQLIPDDNKCFQSKKTGHKFIHNKTGKGLPLFVRNIEEINLYDEINI